MRVVIDFIPHNEQRYPTLGDWEKKEVDGQEVMLIRISKLGVRESEIAIAVHELIEALLCDHDEITSKEVDDWDFAFVEGQRKGEIGKDEEPGDHPKAPYHLQHVIAQRIENELVHSVGMTHRQHNLVCAKVEQVG